MKKIYPAVLFLSLFLCDLSTQAQAFHKGALLLSVSEGSTTAKYATSERSNMVKPTLKFSSEIDGLRDPFFIEFGLSDHWGIGLSSGNDIFNVDSKKYYGFNTMENKPIEVMTSEFTFDLNYHLYSSKRLDLSVYSSVGSFSVGFNEKAGENTYNYKAKGGIVRTGAKLRYYFWKRLGVMFMWSTYSGNASPKEGTSSFEGHHYATKITGRATELGLCFRLF